MDLIGITLVTLLNTAICLVFPKVLHLIVAPKAKAEKKVRTVTVNVQEQDSSSEIPSFPY
ncbi:MAG: hypothetical protein QNJ47_01095 [Nostocaceae cyanobacterium]|nr:hypothetical protein [Nostocaceae cyanobacterium]